MSKYLLIPVQFGSVIYMKRPNPDPGIARGLSAMRASLIKRGEDRFNIENYEGLQRLFLTKALAWSYEEEVRAVCESFLYSWDEKGESIDGLWKKFIKDDGTVGYGLRIASGSITRVFAGLRYKAIEELRYQADKLEFELMRPVDQSSVGYEVHFGPMMAMMM